MPSLTLLVQNLLKCCFVHRISVHIIRGCYDITLRIRTWLLTGELYLRLGQIEAAELCANEARQVCDTIYDELVTSVSVTRCSRSPT